MDTSEARDSSSLVKFWSSSETIIQGSKQLHQAIQSYYQTVNYLIGSTNNDFNMMKSLIPQEDIEKIVALADQASKGIETLNDNMDKILRLLGKCKALTKNQPKTSQKLEPSLLKSLSQENPPRNEPVFSKAASTESSRSKKKAKKGKNREEPIFVPVDRPEKEKKDAKNQAHEIPKGKNERNDRPPTGVSPQKDNPRAYHQREFSLEQIQTSWSLKFEGDFEKAIVDNRHPAAFDNRISNRYTPPREITKVTCMSMFREDVYLLGSNNGLVGIYAKSVDHHKLNPISQFQVKNLVNTFLASLTVLSSTLIAVASMDSNVVLLEVSDGMDRFNELARRKMKDNLNQNTYISHLLALGMFIVIGYSTGNIACLKYEKGTEKLRVVLDVNNKPTKSDALLGHQELITNLVKMPRREMTFLSCSYDRFFHVIRIQDETLVKIKGQRHRLPICSAAVPDSEFLDYILIGDYEEFITVYSMSFSNPLISIKAQKGVNKQSFVNPISSICHVFLLDKEDKAIFERIKDDSVPDNRLKKLWLFLRRSLFVISTSGDSDNKQRISIVWIQEPEKPNSIQNDVYAAGEEEKWETQFDDAGPRAILIKRSESSLEFLILANFGKENAGIFSQFVTIAK